MSAAETFRDLDASGPLILPNAWDAASTVLSISAGAFDYGALNGLMKP